MNRPLIRVVLAVMIATCLMGCAVLTVDVDVYKGRLSLNTKPYDMVVGSLKGSRTILVNLRDRLWTWNYRENDRALSTLRRVGKYESRFIPLDDLTEVFTCMDKDLKTRYRLFDDHRDNLRPLGDAVNQLLQAFGVPGDPGAKDPALQQSTGLEAWPKSWSSDGAENEGASTDMQAAKQGVRETASQIASSILLAADTHKISKRQDSGWLRLFSGDAEWSKHRDDPSRWYAEVLYAVGNSILNEVDELIAQESGDSSDALAARREALDMGVAEKIIEQEEKLLGADTEEKRKPILEYLNVLRRLRSLHTRLRPAGSYLRHATPSPSLQPGTRGRWRNELQEQVFRRGLWPFPPGVKGDADLISDFDKLNWENINSVRVAGGDDTNYVLMRDDIGNWVVKSYSSDPGATINAARKLMAFGAGLNILTGEVTDDAIREQQQRIANDLAAPQVIAAERSRVNEELCTHEVRAENDWAALTVGTKTQIATASGPGDSGLGSSFPQRLNDAAQTTHQGLQDVAQKQQVVTFIKKFHTDRKAILTRSQDRLKAYSKLTTKTPTSTTAGATSAGASDA